MGRRSDHSREQLEELIIAEGHALMADTGYARFSAREVAKRIGYSVGTLYNVFESHDRLVLAINARTLRLWADALAERLGRAGQDRIGALVNGYFDFAEANPNRWMALYDHRMPAGEPLTDDFQEAFGGLIGLIEHEVAAALHHPVNEVTRALTGSLVAIVHGHCTFALNGTYRSFGGNPRTAALARIRAALTVALY